MTGGRERTVMLWDARASLLHARLETAQRELAQLAEIEQPPTRQRRERAGELEAEARRATLALAQLGPSPRAKMG